jgi:hypothetical protein
VERNAYRVLVGKPERKGSHESPGDRWEDNVAIDLKGMGWEAVDWINLA